MRVKVSYSIDLEKVPEEMIKLGQNVSTLAKKELTGAVEDLKDSLIAEKYLVSGENILKLKQTLINLDQTISDLGNMLAGYNSVMASSQVSEGSQDHDPSA